MFLSSAEVVGAALRGARAAGAEPRGAHGDAGARLGAAVGPRPQPGPPGPTERGALVGRGNRSCVGNTRAVTVPPEQRAVLVTLPVVTGSRGAVHFWCNFFCL